MNISIAKTTSETVVTVAGELDADNCAELAARVLETPSDSELLAIDVAGLTFIDSSGVSELIRISEAVGERGQRFELRDPSAPIRRVLEITGLLDHFGLS